ncbi:LPXTG cell wall anchor domain-containing protein [Microbacterium sp. EST19A]|uniref:LPXTG cell wall anchor domain-containing protein n=1 Tax=Microbacterium sp. EST19A TaxID=2862681 RepID=UPI001CBE6769|nr:LPXTG cell wall anchor domain-containing protein [Microbacterium sp. EST19A]
MNRRSITRAGASAVVALALVASASPAWAAPTTEVIQGQVLRLVSVADWDAAGTLLPDQPVQWDVAVSADAPDPGTVTIGVSATGDAPLLLDASLCGEEWEADGCPGGEIVLRSGWDIPRDGSEVRLAEMADTDIAHLRLSIAIRGDAESGSTNVRVHASGEGETVVAGPDGGLATTGPSSPVPWILTGGAVLVLGAGLFVLARRRAAPDADPLGLSRGSR